MCYADLVRLHGLGKIGFDETNSRPPISFKDIALTCLKLTFLVYVFYALARLVIGASDSTIWFIPSLNLALAGLLSILSAIPVMTAQAIRIKSGRSGWKYIFTFMLAAIIAGIGNVAIAGVSAGKPMKSIVAEPFFLLLYSTIAGVILVVSATIHFDNMLKMENISDKNLNKIFIFDSLNAGVASVLAILIASSYWVWIR